MKTLLHALLLALPILTQISCSNCQREETPSPGEESAQKTMMQNTTKPAVQDIAKLKGMWATPCLSGDDHYKMEIYYFFDEAVAKWDISEYADDTCTQPVTQTIFEGSWNTGLERTELKAHELNLNFRKSVTMLFTDAAVRKFNDTTACDKANWLRQAAMECQKPLNRYTLVRIEGSHLYLGKEDDASTPERRAREISNEQRFNRK